MAFVRLKALKTLSILRQSPSRWEVPVARIELLDDIQINAVNKFSGLDYEEKPTLFFEFHGTERSVVEQSQQVAEIIRDQGGSEFVWSINKKIKNKLWQARHDAYYASMALRPTQGFGLPMFVCLYRVCPSVSKQQERRYRAQRSRADCRPCRRW